MLSWSAVAKQGSAVLETLLPGHQTLSSDWEGHHSRAGDMITCYGLVCLNVPHSKM